MKHKMELRFPGEISITSGMQMIPPLRGTKKLPDKEEKSGLSLNVQKPKTMASGPITSRQIIGETMETVMNSIFLGSKITADGDFSHEIKDVCYLEEKLSQT